MTGNSDRRRKASFLEPTTAFAFADFLVRHGHFMDPDEFGNSSLNPWSRRRPMEESIDVGWVSAQRAQFDESSPTESRLRRLAMQGRKGVGRDGWLAS
jgi:hypothetical protein